jgi:hypothetical protein
VEFTVLETGAPGVGAGGAWVVGAGAEINSPGAALSLSRLRFVPLDELSFNPIDVALIKI